MPLNTLPRTLKWLVLLLTIFILSDKASALHHFPLRATIDIGWEFSDGLQEWGSTTTEMGMEVSTSGGVVTGTITGLASAEGAENMPHIDSPRFIIDADDRNYAVIRMRYSGVATIARLQLRTGRASTSGGFAATWDVDKLEPSQVVTDASSSGNAIFVTDGNEYTNWQTTSSTNEWVTLDLQSSRAVSQLRLNCVGGVVNPKHVRLLSGSSAKGKFHTIASMTLTNSTGVQTFVVPETAARYWRIYVVDSYGADAIDDVGSVQVREVELWGAQAGVATMDFNLHRKAAAATGGSPSSDYSYYTYYIPIHEMYRGIITQLRLYPAVEVPAVQGLTLGSKAPRQGEAFELDFIRIMRAPHIYQVEGCFDQHYYSTPPARAFRGDGSGDSNDDNDDNGDGGSSNPSGGDDRLYADHYDIAVANLTAIDFLINDVLPVGRTSFRKEPNALYSTTYNCLRQGGEEITISGTDFGETLPTVTVSGALCDDVSVSLSGRQLKCITPAGIGTAVSVEVSNGALPGLKHSLPYLSYARAPRRMEAPTMSNVAARSIDVSWAPPSGLWEALTTTAYQIGWRNVNEDAYGGGGGGGDGSRYGYAELLDLYAGGEVSAQHVMTVGNVTTTTVKGLESASRYIFWVRPLSENRSDSQIYQLDLYGQRKPLDGSIIGQFSPPSNITATLLVDFHFGIFNANATIEHGAVNLRATLGPRGQSGGEGQYGLALVGSTHLQNCNISASCCDAYASSDAPCSSGGDSRSSAVSRASTTLGCTAAAGAEWRALLNEQERRLGVHTTTATVTETETGARVGAKRRGLLGPVSGSGEALNIAVAQYAALKALGFQAQFVCGSRLRLTASYREAVGAVWYPRMMTVGEGFDTVFTFDMSTPSLRCKVMDDVSTHCRSRGGDGLAFVIHNNDAGLAALGFKGKGLGYDGITNSLAIEFDSYFNADLEDPYENHLSVHTAGWRAPNTAHQVASLGFTSSIPDLTDGPHRVRITYSPVFDPLAVMSAAFQPSLLVSEFLTNADFVNGGMADWGTGLGLLAIYMDDLERPKLVVPLNLEKTLHLEHGRAYVGFTAATGSEAWQTHDLLSWTFTSTREEIPYYPPPLVNGVGAFSCSNLEECVHR